MEAAVEDMVVAVEVMEEEVVADTAEAVGDLVGTWYEPDRTFITSTHTNSRLRNNSNLSYLFSFIAQIFFLQVAWED